MGRAEAGGHGLEVPEALPGGQRTAIMVAAQDKSPGEHAIIVIAIHGGLPCPVDAGGIEAATEIAAKDTKDRAQRDHLAREDGQDGVVVAAVWSQDRARGCCGGRWSKASGSFCDTDAYHRQ